MRKLWRLAGTDIVGTIDLARSTDGEQIGRSVRETEPFEWFTVLGADHKGASDLNGRYVARADLVEVGELLDADEQAVKKPEAMGEIILTIPQEAVLGNSYDISGVGDFELRIRGPVLAGYGLQGREPRVRLVEIEQEILARRLVRSMENAVATFSSEEAMGRIGRVAIELPLDSVVSGKADNERGVFRIVLQGPVEEGFFAWSQGEVCYRLQMTGGDIAMMVRERLVFPTGTRTGSDAVGACGKSDSRP